jgi:hypothetical protein
MNPEYKPFYPKILSKITCEHLRAEIATCLIKYVDENKRRHNPKPFQFSKGLCTPSGGDRGFYGHKKAYPKNYTRTIAASGESFYLLGTLVIVQMPR